MIFISRNITFRDVGLCPQYTYPVEIFGNVGILNMYVVMLNILFVNALINDQFILYYYNIGYILLFIYL